ncbi:MAG: hypothetical protein KGL39_58220, partial [Patescibacteria group bacterium]|nr:hypothetical protein [Patescibacteria group bacterium]
SLCGCHIHHRNTETIAMSASFLTTARPKNAAIAWAYGDCLYVEIPHKDTSMPPVIVRYHRTAMGLADALGILIEHAEAPYSRPTRDVNAGHPAIKQVKSKVTASEDQREAARLALRKLGLL